MTAIIQGTSDKRVVISGIDLTEYIRTSKQTSSFCTPMGRFLEGSGIGRMEKLIVPLTPLDNAGGKKNTTKKSSKGSMVAEMSQSIHGARGE